MIAERFHDAELVRRAIDSAGMTRAEFAALLEIDARTLRRWLSGDSPMPGAVRVMCRAIIRRPAILTQLQAQ